MAYCQIPIRTDNFSYAINDLNSLDLMIEITECKGCNANLKIKIKDGEQVKFCEYCGNEY